MYKLAALIVLGLLAGCAQLGITQEDVDKVHQTADEVGRQIAVVCADTLPLARTASLIPGIPASIAAYVIVACDTVVGIEKLKADPNSIVWLEDMKAKLHKVLHKGG